MNSEQMGSFSTEDGERSIIIEDDGGHAAVHRPSTNDMAFLTL